MGDFADFAAGFVKNYYDTFDSNNREALAGFYSEQAVLSFEGSPLINGRQAIGEKLKGLAFQAVKHATTTVDAQATIDGGLLIVVNGQLQVDEEKPMAYSQTFYLKQQPDGCFIFNDVFRLSVHNF